MSLYLYINLAIILFPLILTFDKRIKYYSKLKPLLPAIAIVAAIFIAWDAVATYRGHWSFNPQYTLDFKILGLPIEEILFFITVPYSTIYAYEAIKYLIKDKKITIPKTVIYAIAAAFAILAIIFFQKEYTFLACLSVSLTLIFSIKYFSQLYSSKIFYIFIGFGLTVFLIFNYILTSMPVVQYSPLAITGVRALTIPIEDFLFNYSLLTLYLCFYTKFSQKPTLK